MAKQWAIVRIDTGEIKATPTLPDNEHPRDERYADWSEDDFSFHELASICPDSNQAILNRTTWDWEEDLTNCWTQLRAERDRRLGQTDWYERPSVVAQTDPDLHAARLAYCQALRDLPANTADPREPEWPEVPA
jgi:hypothetical protein